MIRLLALCVIFVCLYFGFSIIEEFDSSITLAVYGYHLTTTFFTFIALFSFFTIICIVLIKIIFLILDFPAKVSNFFSNKKIDDRHYILMESMTEFILGNKAKSLTSIKKVLPYLKPEYQEFGTLIISQTTEDIDEKTQYLKKLEKIKKYTFFSFKNLANLFLHQQAYEQAELYASKAFNLNELDGEVLEILIDCYAHLSLWKKFAFVVSRLERLDQTKLKLLTNKISEYYLIATREMLKSNDEQEAMNYLRIISELEPHNSEALELYLALKR